MDDATRAAWRRHLGEDADLDALRDELAAGTLAETFAATGFASAHPGAVNTITATFE